jgi:hypothetical protein
MHKKNITNKGLFIYLFLFAFASAQVQEVHAIGGRLFYLVVGHITGIYTAHKHRLTTQEPKDFLPFATSVIKEYPIIKDMIESPFLQNVSKSIEAQLMENENSEKTTKEEIKK